MPGMVFGTVISQQLDEGVTQLLCVCCEDACEHPDAAEFFLLSFPVHYIYKKRETSREYLF